MELASTPFGLFALAQEDSVLKDLLTTLLQSPHVPWEDPYFRHTVSLVTAVSQGVSVLAEESCRILSRPLCSLWNEYEDPVALITGSERKKIEATQHFLNIIYAFVPNLQGEFSNFLYFHMCTCMHVCTSTPYTHSPACLKFKIVYELVLIICVSPVCVYCVFYTVVEGFIIKSDIFYSVLYALFEYTQF
jgi:hypothetical protein